MQGVLLKPEKLGSQRVGRGNQNFSIFGVGPDAGAIESLMEMGFDRVIFALPSGTADEVLPMVEKYAALAHQFNQ